jgi:hypothetical protein
MIEKLIDQLFADLSKITLDQQYKITPEDIQSLKEDSEFREKLSLMLKDHNFEAIKVVELFWRRLTEFEKMESEVECLKQIYHFCQYLSFPESRPEFKKLSLAKRKLYSLFLLTYRYILSWQAQIEKESFLAQYPLSFLSKKEIDSLEQPEEYRNFLKAFNHLFVYEMMALSKEIYHYNTLDHICGVHALALSIARQIQKQGLPIDLGLVSGSAAGHDIGKYGCRFTEQKRVPYLHYYYTDLWFQKHNLPYIGHIAVNHSVWDLELENLPLESLILIYSDFRVKNKENSNEMYIYSLADSFQVILNKLDNVDDSKEKRYRRVFAKLKDFEDFLVEQGVKVKANPLPGEAYQPVRTPKILALLHGEEVIKQIKYLSLDHSFRLMFQLRNESALNSILESARSESNWQNLQEYLRVFSEYTAYLNQNEKTLVLNFLYEQLIYPEEGIRRRSAKLIGYLIANFDEKYRKEIPDDLSLSPPKVKSTELLDKYLALFLEPADKTSKINQNRVRENLALMLESLFENSQQRQITQYLPIVIKYYQKYTNNQLSKNSAIGLLPALKNIPILPGENFDPVLANFLTYFIYQKEQSTRIVALEVIEDILGNISNRIPITKMPINLRRRTEYSPIPAENYLKYKISKKVKANQSVVSRFYQYCLQDVEKIDRMYLNNLKTSTDAIIKKVQIDILSERAILNREETVYTALHFCNILKVSSHEPIRNYAGKALINIIPYLPVEQKNDISIELLKALEIDDYQYTKYIPYYLGQSIPFLPPGKWMNLLMSWKKRLKFLSQGPASYSFALW